MADLTMCTNKECPLKHNCWRFNAIPNPMYQSWQRFEPQIDEILDEIECDHFMKIPETK